MTTSLDMLKYINLARQSPSYFISLIDKQLELFINQREMTLEEGIVYQTHQGRQVWKETRKFLQRQISLPSFQLHQGLNLSAKDHATDLSQHGIFGHTGTDKSTFSERILKYCKKGKGAMAEIIGADFIMQGRNNAEMTVLGLIIDDGVVDRGHRKTIFNPQYSFIGFKSQRQDDKLITVFNLTQNRLQLRGQNSFISSQLDQGFNNSTAPCFKPKYRDSATISSKIENTFNKTDNTGQHFNQHQQINGKESQERTAFDEVSKNIIGNRSPQNVFGKLQTKGGKKITEKKQNSRIFYENGCKITEKVTQIYFTDGTMQENIEKHTIYS